KPFPKREGKKKTPYVFSGKPEEFEFKRSSNSDMSFDDMLLKFKQDSDERISDLKRNTENKRNGGYRR
ncbi:MAG: RNA-binding protein S1, partial [Clostridia bacterium]|nr:RNA-binding protein S1 [Clostridia bacterium]